MHPWHLLGRFDLVLRRNVLIYVNDENKRAILESVHKILLLEGYLLLGATEAIFGMNAGYAQLRDVHRPLYRRI